MKFLTREQIENVLSIPLVLQAIEQGFVLYSQGEAVIPPVASLHFDSPPGDCHIKYGYAKEGKYYVVKISSGFYDNPKIGLPSGSGLMLLFDRQTGVPVCALLDEGYLDRSTYRCCRLHSSKIPCSKERDSRWYCGHRSAKLLPAKTPCTFDYLP